MSIVENCFDLLHLYSDGTIYRSSNNNPRNLTLDDDHYINTVSYKDIIFDQEHDLYIRLYKPITTTDTNCTTSSRKLPILFYFHGGGFCFISHSYPRPHNLCLRLAEGLQALIISPDYRLAPEHRLPAAVDDGFNAIRWTIRQLNREDWLSDEMVDFDKVFLLGDSSGGNMAHHLAVRLGPDSLALAPLRVRGYVLLSPFFGGEERTRRELERPFEAFWTQDIYDQFWRLAIPVGNNRDHPLANPFGPSSPRLVNVGLDPMLVLIGDDEILFDRVMDYATRLIDLGKNVKIEVFEGKQHGFFTNHPLSDVAEQVVAVLNHFMS